MPLLGTLSSRPLTGLSVSARGQGRFSIAVGTRLYSDPDGQTWTLTTGIHSYSTPGIAEGGGTIWVSDRSANVNTMQYSRDYGVTWVSKTLTQSVKWGSSIAVSTNGLNAIASGTNATSAGRYAYITNFTGAWTVNTTPGATTNNTFLQLGFGNNVFVAAHTNLQDVYTSPTGVTLTSATGVGTGFAAGPPRYDSGVTRWQLPKTGATGMYTSVNNGSSWSGNTLAFTPAVVAYGLGRWVAVSSTGNLATSTTGTTWTSGTSLPATSQPGEVYNGLAFGNNVFLLSTNYGKIYSSTNGSTFGQLATAGAGTAATASPVIFVTSWPR